jgi:hypothetical protein
MNLFSVIASHSQTSKIVSYDCSVCVTVNRQSPQAASCKRSDMVLNVQPQRIHVNAKVFQKMCLSIKITYLHALLVP